jgi:DNA topoisomerase-3
MAKDAIGAETTIKVEMGGEWFTIQGLIVEQLNYLEVYNFEKWADKYIPAFSEGERFRPTSLLVHQGSTSAPAPLTESDLITKMDQQGIGTDATIHEHIKTV